LAARLTRLRRRLQSRLLTGVALERSLAQTIIDNRCPEESQPGLFDRREARRFDTSRRDVEILREDAERRVRDLNDRADVQIGRPVLELVLLPPRKRTQR